MADLAILARLHILYISQTNFFFFFNNPHKWHEATLWNVFQSRHRIKYLQAVESQSSLPLNVLQEALCCVIGSGLCRSFWSWWMGRLVDHQHHCIYRERHGGDGVRVEGSWMDLSGSRSPDECKHEMYFFVWFWPCQDSNVNQMYICTCTAVTVRRLSVLKKIIYMIAFSFNYSQLADLLASK